MPTLEDPLIARIKVIMQKVASHIRAIKIVQYEKSLGIRVPSKNLFNIFTKE